MEFTDFYPHILSTSEYTKNQNLTLIKHRLSFIKLNILKPSDDLS